MLPEELEARKQQLQVLTQQLNQLLAKGLALRLQDPTWYLTGVKVGLESLRSFYIISELVYREHTANSEGGRRLANMRRVYDKLVEFAQPAQPMNRRIQLMLEIYQPLQLILREWEGKGAAETTGAARRKTIVGQLAGDIHLNLVRLRSFDKMRDTLQDLLHFKYIFLRDVKRQKIQQFHWQYVGYAKIFGFDDPDVLYSSAYVKQLSSLITEEIKVLDQNAKQIWTAVYHGRFKEFVSGNEFHDDLTEEKIQPVLREIAQAGFDYLDRAYTAYTHAMELAGSDDKLLNQVADLGAELTEYEVRLASK